MIGEAANQASCSFPSWPAVCVCGVWGKVGKIREACLNASLFLGLGKGWGHLNIPPHHFPSQGSRVKAETKCSKIRLGFIRAQFITNQIKLENLIQPNKYPQNTYKVFWGYFSVQLFN